MIKVAVPITGEEEIAAVREVILSGNFVSGKNVAQFEESFADYIGVSAAAATNSGTAALHLAMAALGIGPGDEVIVPALTFMSTVTSVFHQNAIPVFADIDPDNYCISPADIEKRITARTRAIIPVHLYGNAADMDAIMQLAEKHDLKVIEDCAQAHGTEFAGRRVGSIGHLGAFSFFATKHMTTGEGGLVTSDNNDWIDLIKKIRSHGMVNRDDHHYLGYNYRMNEMAAAIGNVQLRKLEQMNRRRIEISLQILERLEAAPRDWFTVPRLAENVRHTFFWCPLRIINGKAREVVSRLRERDVEVRHRYNEPLYKQKLIRDRSPYPGGCPYTCIPDYTSQDYDKLQLPNVEAIAGNMIGLPNHPALTQADIDRVVETLLALY